MFKKERQGRSFSSNLNVEPFEQTFSSQKKYDLSLSNSFNAKAVSSLNEDPLTPNALKCRVTEKSIPKKFCVFPRLG